MALTEVAGAEVAREPTMGMVERTVKRSSVPEVRVVVVLVAVTMFGHGVLPPAVRVDTQDRPEALGAPGRMGSTGPPSACRLPHRSGRSGTFKLAAPATLAAPVVRVVVVVEAAAGKVDASGVVPGITRRAPIGPVVVEAAAAAAARSVARAVPAATSEVDRSPCTPRTRP